jgi:putative iron-dependent peroxidase
MPAVMAGVAFGTQAWEKICSEKKIKLPTGNFNHYVARSGKLGDMPATGGDLFLHVKGATPSLCYEVVDAFVQSFPKGTFTQVDDKYSFQFQDGRDLGGKFGIFLKRFSEFHFLF